MQSFRDPTYVERYEDVYFELDTPLNTTLVNNQPQTKTQLRFVADNSGEISPFDWYNARIMLDFKVDILASGANLTLTDHNGIVNGSHSLIRDIRIIGNGTQLYQCLQANHAVNIKSLLEYSRDYMETTGSNHFFYLDTNGNPVETAGATQNRGFAARKAILGLSSTVNTEIPLNRYSFFESLRDKLLPNTRIEIELTRESDNTVLWQNGAACRVVFLKMKLIVPRITFNPLGQGQYIDKYLQPHKWTYLREMVERGVSMRQQSGSFRITSGISRPRRVFVWITEDENLDDQTKNPFLYHTFTIDANKSLTSAKLEVGNGNLYPESEYPIRDGMATVFRDVLKYTHSINDFGGGTLLTKTNYSSLFQFLYFDLRNQKQELKDGTTKLTFKYTFSAASTKDYSVYGLVLHEQEVELTMSSGKLLIRT